MGAMVAECYISKRNAHHRKQAKRSSKDQRKKKRKLRSAFGAAGAFPFHRRSLLSRSEPSAARKLSVAVGSVNIGKRPGRQDDAQVARVNAQRTSLKVFSTRAHHRDDGS
jgi:hypothetical protein